MDEPLHAAALSSHSVLGLLVVLGYPVLVLAALEAARAMGQTRAFPASVLRQMAFLVLPTGAVWLTSRVLAERPANDWAVRTAETAFALTALYLLLRLAQAALMMVIDDQARAPKLMLDVLRIGLSLVWGAVTVSNIWDVDLGSLFAALGVGSIVLGFALQEFLGNLLSGLGLLSAHKFGIGDWIIVDGAPARVVEMDWRTVTLIKSDGNRAVVANSTLAKGNLVIAARADTTASVTVPLVFGLSVPPEQVREAVLEAGRAMPGLPPDTAVKCLVTAIAADTVTYAAVIPVDNPGISGGPRDEFLSRFWYVAQRRGIRLGAPGPADPVAAPPDAVDRQRMLAEAGAFHGDPGALSVIAHASGFHQYRRTDIVQMQGEPIVYGFLVLSGALAVSAPGAGGAVRIELVKPGQFLVVQETLLNAAASPVQVVADQDSDVLVIPEAALHQVMERSRVIARDVAALAEARRLAIQTLTRGIRAVA